MNRRFCPGAWLTSDVCRHKWLVSFPCPPFPSGQKRAGNSPWGCCEVFFFLFSPLSLPSPYTYNFLGVTRFQKSHTASQILTANMHLEGDSGPHGGVNEIRCVCLKHFPESPSLTESGTSTFRLVNQALRGLGPACTDTFATVPTPQCCAQQYQLADSTSNLHLRFFACVIANPEGSLYRVLSGTVSSKHPGQRVSAAGSFLFTPRMTPFRALAMPSTLSLYFSCLPLLYSFALPTFPLLLVCGDVRR